MRNKYLWWFLSTGILLAVLAVVMLWSLSTGEMDISFLDIPAILKDKSGLGYSIITKIRLPRIILGLFVGGALSLSGVILQGIYRNPLVEPYTLGISGGSAFGAALAIVLNLNIVFGIVILPVFGFIGALITVFMVYFFSVRSGRLNTNSMLLIGVMISFVASSAMMFLMSVTTAENLHSIVFWVMGSLDESNNSLIYIVVGVSSFGLLLSYFYAHPLNALRLGEMKAKHLGVNISTVVKILFVTASLITGVCVSVVGIIGFVGLVIPHLMRMIVGPDFRVLLITSFLGGGVFMIICDVIARTVIAPNELPIGVITGMVGGLVFIFVLNRMKQQTIVQ